MTPEEPIVPIRLPAPAPKQAKSFLERTGAVLLVTKPASYLRSLLDLGINLVIAISGPIGLLLYEGKIGEWSDLSALPVVVSLAPVAAGVVRQWLGRSPGDIEGGAIRDAIRGK